MKQNTFATSKSKKSESVAEFADKLVTKWSETGQLTLRPLEKERLKKLIAASIPKFLEVNGTTAFHKYIETVRDQQLKSCVKAVADIGEQFTGVINKQRAINACAQARYEYKS